MKIIVIVIAVLLFILWIAVSRIAHIIYEHEERIAELENVMPHISQSLTSLCDAIDILDKRTEVLDDENLNNMMNYGEKDGLEREQGNV